MAQRKIERWRKTGRLCSSQDRGFPQNLPEENQEAPQGKTLSIGPGIHKTGVLTSGITRALFCRADDRIAIARFAPSAASASAAASMAPQSARSIIFDCWRGNGINLSMLSRARHEHSPRPWRNNKSWERNPGNQMQDIPADTKTRGPSSRVLQEVIRQAPSEYVTVGWLTSTLHRDSFGIVMLCLGLLATTPVGSTVPRLILAVMAVQLIVGLGKPVFPHFIMTRRLPTPFL